MPNRVSSTADLKTRVGKIIHALDRAYPDARCTLDFNTPFELLVATILAAQCTDERVNMVTPDLFRKYPAPETYAQTDSAELEEDIRSTGFFRNKAKSIKSCARAIVEGHKGEVPRTIEELTALPGVGRKTANVVLGNAYDTPAIVVDTHVRRLAHRIGLTENTNPDKIEADLMPIVPREWWTQFSHMLVFHGRTVCSARKPRCTECVITELCDYPDKTS